MECDECQGEGDTLDGGVCSTCDGTGWIDEEDEEE